MSVISTERSEWRNLLQWLQHEIAFIHQFVRNCKFLAIYLIVSEEQYVYVDRTIRIYPLPFLIILRPAGPSKPPLDILTYLQDHQAFGLGIISLRKIKFIHHRSVHELFIALNSPRICF